MDLESDNVTRIVVAEDCTSTGRVYCGRLVAEGIFKPMQREYDLTRRPVLGSTTMPVDLAFVMARLAHVKQGDVVLDPFAGSCGCLVATTELSRTPPYAADVSRYPLFRAARANFLQHPPVTIEADIRSLQSHLPPDLLFDAIVTDPPYGRRASCQSTWLDPLLRLAAARLKTGGRLVFFIPHVDRVDLSAILDELHLVPASSNFHVDASATQLLPGADWFRTLLVLRRREKRLLDDFSSPPQEDVLLSSSKDIHTSLARAWREKQLSSASGGCAI